MSVRKPIEARAAPINGRRRHQLTHHSAQGRTRLRAILSKAASRALPSGAAGGAAMGLNIMCLMWMRTTVNYQYRYGTGTITAIKTLYEDGGTGVKGITRFTEVRARALPGAPVAFGNTVRSLTLVP